MKYDAKLFGQPQLELVWLIMYFVALMMILPVISVANHSHKNYFYYIYVGLIGRQQLQKKPILATKNTVLEDDRVDST